MAPSGTSRGPEINEFEKLRAFYLGEACDLDDRETTEELVLYDSRSGKVLSFLLAIGIAGSTRMAFDLSTGYGFREGILALRGSVLLWAVQFALVLLS